MLVEVYGSLLNQDERKKIRGTMAEKGKVERKAWKLSFDKKRIGRDEAVLNFVPTNDVNDLYYSAKSSTSKSRKPWLVSIFVPQRK